MLQVRVSQKLYTQEAGKRVISGLTAAEKPTETLLSGSLLQNYSEKNKLI